MPAECSSHKEMDVNSIVTLVLIITGVIMNAFWLLFSYEWLRIERRREQWEIVSFKFYLILTCLV